MYYVYRTYDKDNNPLYFGCTSDFFARIDMHRIKEWWAIVHKFEIDRYKTRYEALWEEEKAIKKESPRFNLIHHPDYKRNREKYLKKKMVDINQK